MADGEIVIETDVDVRKTEAKLTALDKKVEALKQKIEQKQTQKNSIEQKLKEAQTAAEQTRRDIESLNEELRQTQYNLRFEGMDASQRREQLNDLRRITGELDRQQRDLKTQEGTVSRLRTQDAAITDELGRQCDELRKTKQTADKLSKQLRKASGVYANLHEKAEGVAASMDKFKHRLKNITKRVLLFQLATKALTAFREWFGDVIGANEELTQKIAKLKGAFLTAIQPVLNVVIPAFSSLLDVLTRIVAATASITAILFGTTTQDAADQAEALEKETDAISNIGDAAESAGKQLASFDTINKLSGNSKSGSSTGTSADYGAVKDYQLPAWLDNLTSTLKISIDDILFNWEDLTPEDIAKKVVSGLITIFAGIVGFSLGGVPGAIIGTLTGLTLAGVVNNLIFDNDGKLSKAEIANMVVYALTGLAGGIIGFAVGGVPGALIGATVGIALTALVESLSLKAQQKALKAFYDTEVGQFVKNMKDHIEKSEEFSLELKARISSITGEVDSQTQSNFNVARELIGQIFDLDAKDNKTAAEIERIQSLISAVNAMGLGDFNLTWDEATGHVAQTKEEILNAIDAQYAMVKLQKKIDALVELEMVLEDAQSQLVQAQKDAEDAEKAYWDFFESVKDDMGSWHWWTEDLQTLQLLQAQAEAAKAVEQEISQTIESTQVAINSLRESIGLGLESTAQEAGEGGKLIIREIGAGMARATTATAAVAGVSVDAVMELARNQIDAATIGEAAHEQGASISQGLAEGIESNEWTMRKTLSGALNGLLSIAKNAVAAINSALNGISATIEVSAGVSIGAQAAAVNAVKNLRIPHLAKGCVIPANREFLAVLGDQKSGTNIETPLSTMVDAFRAALAGQRQANAQSEAYMVVDDEIFAKIVYKLYNQEQRRVGITLAEDS